MSSTKARPPVSSPRITPGRLWCSPLSCSWSRFHRASSRAGCVWPAPPHGGPRGLHACDHPRVPSPLRAATGSVRSPPTRLLSSSSLPDDLPALIRIIWPLQPHVADPHRFTDSAALIARLLRRLRSSTRPEGGAIDWPSQSRSAGSGFNLLGSCSLATVAGLSRVGC
ncbi:MAG: hypothetical protein K0R13_1414 [Propionibacteriaceae bacterium]|nr:hypothetical protein [Propionibacteriaceae bacterium]